MSKSDAQPVEPDDVVAEEAQPSIPALPRRVLDTFFSPGKLAEALAQKPLWAGALLLGMVLGGLQFVLIPAEVWDQLMRDAALEGGSEVPEWMGTFMWYFRVIGAPVGIAVYVFLKGGITALVFSFVLGDGGRFRQYLSVVAHSQLVPLGVGLLLVYPRVVTGDIQLTLSVGSFFFFLPDGYWLKALTLMDLTQLWAWLIVAQGAHAIDARRSFMSAALVLMGWAVLVAMLLALLPTMPSG